MLPMKCNLCNVTFTSDEIASQHLAGKRHQKATKIQTVMLSFQNCDTNINPSKASGNEPTPTANNTLPVTNGSSADISANTVLGDIGNLSAHDKKIDIRRNHLFTSQKAVSVNGKDVSICEVDTVEQYCSICSIMCTGLIPYTQHLQSPKHIKKKEALSHLQSLSSYPYYCETCKVSCSGEVPYQQHTISVKHQKKLCKNGSFLEVPNYLPSEKYTCDLCSFSCEDDEVFVLHLQTTSHMEKKTTSLHQKIEPNRTKTMIQKSFSDRDLENDAMDKISAKFSDVVITKPGTINFPNVCQVCNKVFNNQVSAKLHFLSELHEKKFKLSKDLEYVLEPEIFCDVCLKFYKNPEELLIHKQSLDHLKKNEVKSQIQQKLKLSSSLLETNTDTMQEITSRFLPNMAQDIIFIPEDKGIEEV